MLGHPILCFSLSLIPTYITGALPLSGGEALVLGHPISAPAGLAAVRAAMGVCPQFDVLWPELTGREHLVICALVKGLRLPQVWHGAGEQATLR